MRSGKTAVLVVLSLALAACATAPYECAQIQTNGAYPIDKSWLVDTVDPAKGPRWPAFSFLLQQMKEGDQIWRYRAPEAVTPPPMPVSMYGTVAQNTYRGNDGYVLLRDCKAVAFLASPSYNSVTSSNLTWFPRGNQ